jgi:hypothetical protein
VTDLFIEGWQAESPELVAWEPEALRHGWRVVARSAASGNAGSVKLLSESGYAWVLYTRKR